MFKLTIVLTSAGVEEGIRPITVSFPADDARHVVDLSVGVDGKRTFALPHSSVSPRDALWVQGGYNDGQALCETDIWLSLLPKRSLEVSLEWPFGGLSGRTTIDVEKGGGAVEQGGML